MTSENITVEYVSWKQIYHALVEIAVMIKNDNYKPDIIVGVFKGGLIPARILADLLSIDNLGFIGVKFYKGVGERDVKPILVFPPTPSVRDLNVLVVDDVIESGRTIQLVVDELYRYKALKVKIATIFVKKRSPIMPDYYYKMTDKWIVFPWEIVETVKQGIQLNNLGDDNDLYLLLEKKLLNPR